ncbi:unnamed protein product [Paramecium sonneborni]|uniref:NADH:flavin oxidoreductase/NADH oxidase N-terminal domain-containing protein n=1 Tax=Paramecium sonneborni TaxID=65129 RepID=A0A8S1LU08_9CILI|nr:unnamed protein product [Paramecium sonneborni]
MDQSILFKPLKMGDIELPNRICMAALTRQRCETKDLVPNDMMIEYYGLRAEAGFILTECVPISQRSLAFPGEPGMYTKEQIQGWKKIVDDIHSKGGRIFAQIWHAGRASLSTLQDGLEIWGPSPIKIRGIHRGGLTEHEIPHEMTIEEIQEVIQQFRQTAENCKEAGFDGVELHGAHGYIIDQFLRDSSNQRTDEYGGSVENRSKLCLQVIDEFINVFGKGRVGIKISPVGRLNDQCDSDPLKLYTYLIQELEKKKIAFIEVKDDKDAENQFDYGYPSSKDQIPDLFEVFRPLFSGILIANNQYTPSTAIEGIEKGRFDAVTFGRLFISNPDLVERIRQGYELNTNWDVHTFYTKGIKGYLDYPLYSQQQK